MRWAHVAGGDVQCSGSVERDLVVGCFCGVESSQCKIHLAVSTLGDPLFFASMGLSGLLHFIQVTGGCNGHLLDEVCEL